MENDHARIYKILKRDNEYTTAPSNVPILPGKAGIDPVYLRALGRLTRIPQSRIKPSVGSLSSPSLGNTSLNLALLLFTTLFPQLKLMFVILSLKKYYRFRHIGLRIVLFIPNLFDKHVTRFPSLSILPLYSGAPWRR